MEKKSFVSVSGISAFFFCIALVIRLIHNGFVIHDPLYYFPVGGHLPYIVAAEKIVLGDLFPFDTPFTLNSPLYPYLLGIIYYVFGIGNLLMARLLGIVLDSLTCVMVSLLAEGYFGRLAGAVAGLITVFYGPMIFYSAELVGVPYTLFFIAFGILLLERNGNIPLHVICGVMLGLAIGTSPNLLILAILVVLIYLIGKRDKKIFKSIGLSIGIIVAILPITLANYWISGNFILLTTSAGHNFYIGHNPESSAGYTLPESLDGDIFLNMKRLAEKTENRKFADNEVSSYYMSKALTYIIHNPVKELRNTGSKILAALNYYEATTYANYYYQKELSPVLAYSIHFGLLFPLAALGMVIHYKRYLLIMPIAASIITMALFFYIARLRMPMIPFLAIFAGGAISTIFGYIKDRRISKVLLGLLLITGFGLLSNIKLVAIDTSNEWNKVGVVLRVQQKYEEAEKAFFRAIDENNRNPNSYLNLSVLYNKTGDLKRALEMKNKAEQLGDKARENTFIQHLYK